MRSLRLVLLGALPLLAASPVSAQWYDGPRGYYGYNAPPPPYGYGYGPPAARVLPRDLIVERLEDLGFDDVGRPRLDGDVYTVTAVDPNGRRVRVAVDAYRGTVLRRVGLGAPDGLDERDIGRRRGPSPYPDEMPGAPRFRDPPDAIARAEPEPSAPPRLAPAAPVESRPIAPPASARPAPADRRLAPSAEPSRPAPDPRVEAARPDAGAPDVAARSAPAPSAPAAAPTPPSGPVYGTNPETSRPRAAAKPQPAPSAPKPPAVSPAVPAPSVTPRQAETPPAAATAEGPRRPVRVIQGVTPLNSGGAQSTPGPQNNQAATPGQ